MSKESILKAAQAIPAIKILPPQINKLKKEEEEETWISGEELYTEGSSDEENCRCTPRSTDLSNKESSLSLVTRPHRSKGKTDKKHQARAIHLRSTSIDDDVLQSTSKSSSCIAKDEEEEYVADDEISWKANRGTDEFQLEDEMFVLQEYPKICDSMDSIFRDLIEKLNDLESIENDNYSRKNEDFENNLKSNTAFFDAAIDKLRCDIEGIKQKTRRIQSKNRLRLSEIMKEGPQSKKLSENDKQFIDLFDQDEFSNLKDVTSESSEVSKSEIQDRVQMLSEPIISEEEITNLDFMLTACK